MFYNGHWLISTAHFEHYMLTDDADEKDKAIFKTLYDLMVCNTEK